MFELCCDTEEAAGVVRPITRHHIQSGMNQDMMLLMTGDDITYPQLLLLHRRRSSVRSLRLIK